MQYSKGRCNRRRQPWREKSGISKRVGNHVISFALHPTPDAPSKKEPLQLTLLNSCRSRWMVEVSLSRAWIFRALWHMYNDPPALCAGPYGLTFTWWGCCGLCFWHKPTELAHSVLICSCVYFCLYGPFNCISFYKFSQQLSAFSLCSSGLISTLLVLSTRYLFMKVPPSALM